MPHETPLIATLVAALVLAYLGGMLARWVKLSPLVGYLLAGVLVGPFTPGYVADQALAPELAEIGVILLMFGVGLHFSLGDLLEVKKIAIPGAIVQIAIATAFGGLLAWGLGWTFGAGLVFGLALSVASTVVLLRALEERRLVQTTRGRIAIGWLIVEDLAMVLVLVLLPAVAGVLGGGDGGTPPGTIEIVEALAITLGKVAAFVALMLVVGRRVIPWILERTAGTGSRELFTLGVLAIALGVAFASARLFDVSFALGAFFAGMVLNESRLSQQAAEDSLPLRDAFAVLFFVSVGMLFDPSIVIREPLPVLATFLIITLGKSLAALAIVRAFRQPLETGLTIAVSLAQIGEFSFILATLGVSLGLLQKPGQDLILAGAILSVIANPLFFVALDRFIARRAAAAVADAKALDSVPLPTGDHIILVGFGRVGSLVGKSLREKGAALVLIETNRDLLDDARALGIPCIAGNAAASELLVEANVARARALLVAIPQIVEANQIIRHARALNPQLAILARAHSDADTTYLIDSGADAAVMGEREIARSMCESVDGLTRYFTPDADALPLPAR